MDIYLYDKDTRSVTFSEFINKELVLFSNTDNERSIPSLVDGLKPGQRKVLFTCFKRADKKEVKVAQLAGAVGEMSAYHHGEQSLMSTIVNLAQNYVGSNNINLLMPIGQFGTRLQGGKDNASPRYIFTQLNPVTKTLFPPSDENVLRFLYEENQRIEPEWYCPVIPTVLANGAEGIGTGWSTVVPNYNPRELVDQMRRLIKGDPLQPMIPWYKGFTGEIVGSNNNGKFESRGIINVIENGTVEITELPVKTWTQTYKEKIIEPMFDGSEKNKPQLLQDYKEYHTDTTVHFICRLKPDDMAKAEQKGLYDVFSLKSSINTSNMVLFDAAGCLRKFETPEQICQEFFDCRKELYKKRKAYLEGMLQAQSNQLSEKARFIMMKINGEIHIENKRKSAIIEQLQKHKFKPDPVKQWKEEQKRKELEMCGEANLTEDEEEDEAEENEAVNVELEKKVSDYDYLVGMAIWKLSMEDKDKLLAESEAKKKELNILKGKEWFDLYEEDLKTFLDALDAQEEKETKEANAGKIKPKIKMEKIKKRQVKDDSDSDSDFIVKKKEKRRQIVDDDDEPDPDVVVMKKKEKRRQIIEDDDDDDFVITNKKKKPLNK
ncbi:unnamed protein product [Meloidogyne enterolobii]|uniref:Uncharacterized protein n=1 Tax=Meloidogyne enterolobii TaxID=390850 RepID=A0ACB0Y2I2_MELEN